MSVSGNATSFHGRGLNVSHKNTSMFNLHDGYVSFNLTDLILDFDIGYEFISDPAIIADLGFMNISLHDFDMLFNLTTGYIDNNITLNVTYVHVSIE